MALTGGEKKGFESWGQAVGLLITFLSVTAAISAVRNIGKGPGEHILLLRSINKKLGTVTPEPMEGYYDSLINKTRSLRKNSLRKNDLL